MSPVALFRLPRSEPALHRRAALGRERGLETVDRARRRQLVVAPEEGERATVIGGRPCGRAARLSRAARSAGPVQASRRTSAGRDARGAADVGLEPLGSCPDGAQLGVVPAGLATLDADRG